MRKKKVLEVMLALFFIGITLNIAQVSSIETLSFHQVQAQAKLSRRVFWGVGDIEEPYWQHIYVINPTRYTVEIESVQIDFCADDFQISYLLTPDWLPERWNTEVLPWMDSRRRRARRSLSLPHHSACNDQRRRRPAPSKKRIQSVPLANHTELVDLLYLTCNQSLFLSLDKQARAAIRTEKSLASKPARQKRGSGSGTISFVHIR
jgi:hypothetical protein